jgi:hypothetical protein
MSRIPYRATMRPRRPHVVSTLPTLPTSTLPTLPDPAPVVDEPVVALAPEPVVVQAPEVAPEPVLAPVVDEPVLPVVGAPVQTTPPRVNSASSKTDLLAAAAALGLTLVTSTNTRAEIWAAIQAAT